MFYPFKFIFVGVFHQVKFFEIASKVARQSLIIVINLVPALEFFVQRPVNECKNDVPDEEHNPVVEPEPDFHVAHGDEHERPSDEEQRKLPALVAERIAAFVAYDGVHHWKTGAKTAHQALDEHESGNHACDGGCFYIYRKRSLVTHAGLVFLFLEKDDADDKVEKAGPEKVCFAFGDARVQKGAETDEKGEPRDDGKHDRDLCFIVEQAHNMYVQHAHEPGNGVFGAHRESDGDIGETAGDRDGRRDGFELRIFQVGAQSSEGGHHKDE